MISNNFKVKVVLLMILITVVIIYSLQRERTEETTEENVDFLITPNRRVTETAPCGQICSYTGSKVEEIQPDAPQLLKQLNCTNIIKRMANRNQLFVNPPPEVPPPELLDEFTMYGTNPILSFRYFSTPFNDAERPFTKTVIDELIIKARRGEQLNTYAEEGMCIENAVKKYSHEIAGGHGLVIGSISPWLESLLLANGAADVITLEYSPTKTDDDRLQIHSPYTYAEMYLEGKTELFDAGATFSSLEHSGLGRFTDALNPYGDLEAMAQTWCLTKPGGLFFLGIPMGKKGGIVWNAHRIYGAERLQHMAANWQLLAKTMCHSNEHGVITLRKPK